MKNPIRPHLYIENNFLCLKSYTNVYSLKPTVKYTLDNNKKISIYNSYAATITIPMILAIFSMIMIITMAYDINNEMLDLNLKNILTIIILGIITIICFIVRPLLELLGQKIYNNLINNNKKWLDNNFRVNWTTFESNYKILTTEEAEYLEIESMKK